MIEFRRLALGAAIAGVALSGCTAVKVQPVSGEHRLSHVCIQHNPKVQVSDFVAVMQEGFNKHGITSEVVNGRSGSCSYTATYTARRSWDFTPYLSQAQIDIQRDGRQIATAHYHLRGKGGFSLTKWEGTRSKILPVIDQLLANLNGGVVTGNVASAAAEPSGSSESSASGDLAVKLAHLKDAYDADLLTTEEYETKRRQLIDNL